MAFVFKNSLILNFESYVKFRPSYTTIIRRSFCYFLSFDLFALQCDPSHP